MMKPTSPWIDPKDELPKLGERVCIRLNVQRGVPYGRLPGEIDADYKLHEYYRMPQFSPGPWLPDGTPWCLYVDPNLVEAWRPIEGDTDKDTSPQVVVSPEKMCSVEGCCNRKIAKGYCSRHYQEAYNGKRKWIVA